MLGISNTNATMYFLQLHYFYRKTLGYKRYCVPLPNVRGTFAPRPPKLAPGHGLIDYCDVIM